MRKYFLSIVLSLFTLVTFSQQAKTFDWWAGEPVDVGPPPEVEWFDQFLVSGGSVSATWNTDVNPLLINLGSGGDYTTVDATKPFYNSVNGTLEFTAIDSSRVESPTSYVTSPPVHEIWIRGSYEEISGTFVALGNNSVFGIFSDGGYYSNGMSQTVAGDFNEHVFRIVLNGASSIFQIDNGTPIVFTEGNGFSTRYILGIKQSGGDPASFHMKSYERTADGTVLSPAQVNVKWTEEGF